MPATNTKAQSVPGAFAIALTALLLCAPKVQLSSRNAATHVSSFIGVIMDSKCATTGSHSAMMKKIGARNARECTMQCAMDGSFVLYDPKSQRVYQLDDQQKPEPFAGQKVKVTGGYEEKSQMIEIDAIEATR